MGAAGDGDPGAASHFTILIPISGAVPDAGASFPGRGDYPNAICRCGGLIFQEDTVIREEGDPIEDERSVGELAPGAGAAGGVVGARDVGPWRGAAHGGFLGEISWFPDGTGFDDGGPADRERCGVKGGSVAGSAAQVVGGPGIAAIRGVVDVAEAASVGCGGGQGQFHERAHGQSGVSEEVPAGLVPEFGSIEERIKPIGPELAEHVVGADGIVGGLEAADFIIPCIRHPRTPSAQRGRCPAGIEFHRSSSPTAAQVSISGAVIPSPVPGVDLIDGACGVGVDLVAVVAPAGGLQANGVGIHDGDPFVEAGSDHSRREGPARPDHVPPGAVRKAETVFGIVLCPGMDGGGRKQGGSASGKGGHAGDAVLVLVPHEVFHIPGHHFEGAVFRTEKIHVFHVRTGIASSGSPVAVSEIQMVDHVILEPWQIQKSTQTLILCIGKA